MAEREERDEKREEKLRGLGRRLVAVRTGFGWLPLRRRAEPDPTPPLRGGAKQAIALCAEPHLPPPLPGGESEPATRGT